MNASGTKGAFTVGVEAFQERLQAGDSITVLEVRPADERAEWSIPGSTYVDAYDALKRNDPDALLQRRPAGGAARRDRLRGREEEPHGRRAAPPNYVRIVALNEAGATAPGQILDLEAGANRCAIS